MSSFFPLLLEIVKITKLPPHPILKVRLPKWGSGLEMGSYIHIHTHIHSPPSLVAGNDGDISISFRIFGIIKNKV